jgi:hypothetical protein
MSTCLTPLAYDKWGELYGQLACVLLAQGPACYVGLGLGVDVIDT